MMNRKKVIGLNAGHKVIAEYVCGDDCPSLTSRHIHYDVDPGPECDAVGGVDKEEGVSRGVENASVYFCVPKILTRKDVAANQVY